MTQVEFIKKAISLYGKKYDYSKVKYVNNKTKVTIICNRCGNVFEMRPNDFLSGNGCKKCRRFFDKEHYVQKFKKKHGDNYDYSLMSGDKLYTSNDIIKIICPKHGPFEQRIKNHLCGNGCQSCGFERMANSIKIDNIL